MNIPDVVRNNLTVSLISLAVGSIVTTIIAKLNAKTARLRFSTRVERIALAADDPVFGSVRIAWGAQGVRNLYMATVEIENASNRDFENVEFKLYTANETFLLNERTSVVNSPFIVEWSAEFKTELAVPEGSTPTARQLEIYNHSRQYKVPVLNRGDLLHFSFLCTRPNDDLEPGVFVSTRLKGAKMVHQVRANLMLGVPVQIAILRGLVVAAGVVIASGVFFKNVWAAAGLSMVVGLFAQTIGAAEYRLERWIGRLLSR